ncbi:Fis family transcriptional regulator [Lachnoclostridium sp. An298]|nr:Fis family transcriptional regulator [Lachnoclostridium sp. An298]
MKKLLIVDDNLDYLGLLVSVFEKHFEVYEASGVKEALSVLEDKEIDAICSDFNLRDGTGLGLLKEIRQKNLTVPFLLMSGDDGRMLEKEAKQYGGVFCCKTHYDFLAKVRELVNIET